MIFDLQELSPALIQYYLQHVVAPRPVCFASTVDLNGHVNLSPFSFFNLFSYNPPIVIFSPVTRVRDGSTKHTLQNVIEVPEVVINIVTYDMVHQASLASCEFPKGDDEFTKAGFTKEEATMVKPPMVKESKVKLECKVSNIMPLGKRGGAGNLVICEVMMVHIADELLNADKEIDQTKLELIARLGRDWYCKVSRDNLFQVPKPNTKLGIGVDALPENIRNSRILTGNHLGMLGNVDAAPVMETSFDDEQLTKLFECHAPDSSALYDDVHRYAAKLLDENKVLEAWQVLLRAGNVDQTL